MMRSFTQFFKNKIALTAIGIIIICLLVWLYFFIREGEKKNSMDAMRAIPADVVYALRINDLKQFNARLSSEGEMTSLLRQERSMTDVVQMLSFIVDTLATENVAAGDLIMQPMWVSAHIFGRDIAFLFSLNLPDNLYLANVKHIISTFSHRGYIITENSYDDERITTFKREDVEIFHAAVVRRVLVVSSSRVLVEMAIRQARVKSSLADNLTFLAASKTAGAHVDVNLYVNHKQLPKLLNLYLAKPYARSMNFIARSGDFLVLDALLKNEAMQLSGFLFAEDMQESCFSIFRNQKSQKITSLEILPRVTDGLLSISISDVKLLIKDYTLYYSKEIGTGRNLHGEQQKRIIKRTGVNPEQWYSSLHSTELSLAHVPITGVEEKDMWFIVIKSGKADAARRAVRELISTAARMENKKEEDYVKTDLMSNNEPLTVYQNPVNGLTAAVFGGVFEQCPENYFTIIGDYIIFSSSRNALKEFALAALLKRTLAQTINISNYIASESNLLVYL
ncbi:MAG: hypothetical protein LBH34_01075, partial [Prevotellaceae bacterium]|nr:hypothetical protein [Prevotellaceae bacterium]